MQFIKWLVGIGTDVNVMDHSGNTPLDISVDDVRQCLTTIGALTGAQVQAIQRQKEEEEHKKSQEYYENLMAWYRGEPLIRHKLLAMSR